MNRDIYRWIGVRNNKKYILVSDIELLSPLEFFLGDRSVFCSDEKTFGRLIDEGWSSERPSHDYKLGTFNFTLPILCKGGRG